MYSAALLIETALQHAFRVVERLRPSAWISRHVVIPDGVGAVEPGPMDTSRVPPLEGLYDLLEQRSVRFFTLAKSARVGGTLFCIAYLLYRLVAKPRADDVDRPEPLLDAPALPARAGGLPPGLPDGGHPGDPGPREVEPFAVLLQERRLREDGRCRQPGGSRRLQLRSRRHQRGRQGRPHDQGRGPDARAGHRPHQAVSPHAQDPGELHADGPVRPDVAFVPQRQPAPLLRAVPALFANWAALRRAAARISPRPKIPRLVARRCPTIPP